MYGYGMGYPTGCCCGRNDGFGSSWIWAIIIVVFILFFFCCFGNNINRPIC